MQRSRASTALLAGNTLLGLVLAGNMLLTLPPPLLPLCPARLPFKQELPDDVTLSDIIKSMPPSVRRGKGQPVGQAAVRTGGTASEAGHASLEAVWRQHTAAADSG
jgi:hypothetical protein